MNADLSTTAGFGGDSNSGGELIEFMCLFLLFCVGFVSCVFSCIEGERRLTWHMDTKLRFNRTLHPTEKKYGKVRIDGKLLTSSFRRWGCMGTAAQEFSN